MPQYKTDAIILSTADFMESDRIVYALTRDQGLVCAIAKGALRSRRRFPGALEPFCEVLLDMHGAKATGLQRIEQATLTDAHIPLREDLALLGHASLLLEVARENLGQQDPAPAAYACLKEALGSLDGADRWFGLWCISLLELLRVLGYGVDPDALAGRKTRTVDAAVLEMCREARVFMEKCPGLGRDAVSRVVLSERARADITRFLLERTSMVSVRPLKTVVFLAKLLDLGMKQCYMI
jgi:DNA repair protein RecO